MLRATYLAIAIAGFIGVIASPRIALANDYHVSLTGSDTTGHGTARRPWRTITFALGAMPAPVTTAHTLLVHPGTWYPGGAERFPLNVPPGVHVRGVDRTRTIIAGTRTSSRSPSRSPLTQILFEVDALDTGALPVPEISNFTLTAARYAISVNGSPGRRVRALVHDCSIALNQFGIVVMNAAPVISANTFDGNANGVQIGNIVTNGPEGLVFGNHFVRNNSGLSLSNAFSMRIGSNRFEFNGIGINMAAVSTVTMRPVLENNCYFDNGSGLVVMAALGGKCLPTVMHESFYANDVGIASLDGGPFGGMSDPDIVNTVVWGSTRSDLVGVAQDEIRSSSIRTVTGVPQGPIFGLRGMVSLDPRFRDPVRGDLRLRNDSPVIEIGATLPISPAFDREGEPRVTGLPDLGCDEVNDFLRHQRAGSVSGQLRLVCDAPREAGQSFRIVASTGTTPPVRFAGRVVPLRADGMFFASLGPLAPAAFTGRFNGAGQALIRLSLPRHLRAAIGPIHFAFVAFDAARRGDRTRTVSNVVTIDPGTL